jgi:hypothetical protein
MKCITEILTTSFFLCHFVIFRPLKDSSIVPIAIGNAELRNDRKGKTISAFVISQLYEVLRTCPVRLVGRNLSFSFMV